MDDDDSPAKEVSCSEAHLVAVLTRPLKHENRNEEVKEKNILNNLDFHFTYAAVDERLMWFFNAKP